MSTQTLKPSQCTRILRLLAQGETLTTMKAMRRLGICALSQRAGDLKRQGWPIVSRKSCRGPWHEYFIPAAKAALVRRRMGR
jgi:hypothetical protein